jgi:phenylacetate-CoA ligase
VISLATKTLYYPLLDAVKGIPFRAAFADARAHEALSSSALEDLALARLREALARAATGCDHYAEAFKRHGARVDDVRSLRDLARFPILEKSQVFEGLSRLKNKDHRGQWLRGTTSGSTGIAMTFFHDPTHYAWVDASQWRGRRWWGLERGDTQLVLWSRPVDNTLVTSLMVWIKFRLRNSIQFDTFRELTSDVVDRILRAIRRWRPRIIYGYGSSIGRLGLELERRGIVLPPKDRPVLIEYTADHMPAQERRMAQVTFGAPVISAYGSSECGGVAQQCRSGNLHISIDHTIAEFVRDDGSYAEPGETATILLTQLNNAAMPLVRFKVGDLGSYSAAACPCGSPLPIMNLEVGKIVDLISTSTKTRVSAHLLDYINIYLMKNQIPGVRQFLVEQTGTDSFRLSIVKDRVFDTRCVDVFVAKMKEYLGDQIVVEVGFVAGIPLQKAGKRRYFVKRFADADRMPVNG